MVDNLIANPDANKILSESTKEVSLFWQGKYTPAKARLDCLGNTYAADLKTTTRIVPREFQNQAWGLGYHIQAAWGLEGLKACGHECNRFLIIAVESKPPYDVCVYEMSRDLVNAGKAEALEITRKYSVAKSVDTYSGCSVGVNMLNVPAWATEGTDLDFGE